MVGDGDDLEILLNRRIHDGLWRHGDIGHVIRTVDAVGMNVKVSPPELRAIGELFDFVDDHLRAQGWVGQWSPFTFRRLTTDYKRPFPRAP